MSKPLKNIFKFAAIIVAVLVFFQAYASDTVGTISSTNHTAQVCEDTNCTVTSTSPVNFGYFTNNPSSNVTVTDSDLRGYIWGKSFGWAVLNCVNTSSGCSSTNGNFKVSNDGEGNLSGYAWGENTGWINFGPFANNTASTVKIDTEGKFSGYAWAENFGWIKFDCGNSNYCVETDWRPASSRSQIVGSSGASSSSQNSDQQDNSGNDVCPNLIGIQSLIPTGLVISSAGNCITPQQCNIIDTNLKQPLDTMVVIDRSGSMAGTKLNQAKTAADAFINNLIAGSDRVGYVSYSNGATLVNGLTTSLASVDSKIQQTTAGGSTNIGGALKSAYQELKGNSRNGVKHVIILMTDGQANVSDINSMSPNQYATYESDLAKKDGIIVYTVGLGNGVDSNLLKKVATQDSNYYYSPTGNDLSDIYLKIAAIECTAAPSIVSDIIINDSNGNGNYDSGETGLGGVEVSLISKDGSQPTRTTTSSSDGSYSFNDVAPGDYSVCLNSINNGFQTFPASSNCHDITVIQGIDVNGIPFFVDQVDNQTPQVPAPSTVDNNNQSNQTTDNNSNTDNNTTTPDSNNPVQPTNPIPDNTVEPTTPPPTNEQNNYPEFPPKDNYNLSDSQSNSQNNSLGKVLSIIVDGLGNTRGLINGTSDLISRLISDPAGSVAYKSITLVGAVTGATFSAMTALFATPISLPELFMIPMRLWSLLLLALGIKKRNKPWGTVYDSVTKQPLDPAYVVLQDLNGNEVATSITDLDGRYGFLVPAGQYRIIANKTNYEFPSKKLNGQNRDQIYNDLYFDEIITVAEDGSVITKNIPMDPLRFDWNEFTKNKQHLMKFFSRRNLWISRIANILFILGFALSLIAMVVSPVAYNIIIFAVYIILFILRKTVLKPRPHGYVIRKETKEPLSFAVVRLFFIGSDQEVIHKITDKTGRYYCLVANGVYYAKIENKNSDQSYSLVHQSGPIEVKKGYLNKRFEI